MEDPVITPEPDEAERLDADLAGAVPPVAPGEAAGDGVDEDELDRRWGFTPAEPLVGFGAPPVVAVMITKDPGDWFEQTLESLADQDYETLSVLVIDNGGSEDPTPRIAEVLPSAFVKRLDQDRGFSTAANEVLSSVEGAAFYLFLHDDVRLDPDAVTNLVAEAFRSTAGVVGPKLLDWHDPARLSSVGYSVDPYGVASPLAEPGELDQSQHDTSREVFAVSDAAMLVRADLFVALGGFEERVPYFGQDLDLCWRVHVAAGAVYFCPSARVAHLGAFPIRHGRASDLEERDRVRLRHQARSMLSNYEPFRLMRLLPAAFVLSLVDLLGSVLLGRFRRGADVLAAWGWNLLNLPGTMRSRSSVKRVRRAHDAEYLPLMRQGSARLSELVRVEEGEGRFHAAATAGRGYVQQMASESNRVGAALAVLCAAIVVVGGRGLLTGDLPVMREFVSAGDSAAALLGEWWSGWREAGFGESSVAPGVVPGLGLLGTLLFGSVGLARRILLVAPLFVGALGAWKLFADTTSLRARAAMLAAYGLNPVALNAVAEARLQALVAYGAAPWLLRRLARRAELAPFGSTASVPALRHAAGTALILCLVGAVTPLGLALVLVSLLVFAAAQAVAGERRAAATMAASLGVAVAVSLPVLGPWILTAASRGDLSSITGMWSGRAAAPSAGQLISGDLGPVSVGVLGWGLVVAAAYALSSGRSWRLTWALGGWALAVMSWVATILVVRADAAAGAGPELLLVPAALGLSVSVAMGAFAFERDVIGSDFGVPQLLSGLAAAALVVALVPAAVGATNGRWYLPQGDFDRVLDLVDDDAQQRAVWIGDPDVLPASGWSLESVPGLAVAVTSGLDPTVTQRYRLDPGPGVQELLGALDAAMAGETSRLGRILSPMGIGYVILVDRPAPQPFAPLEVPVPAGAKAALSEQLDLSEVDGLNPAMALFEVDGTWPLRSDVTDLGEQALEEPSSEALLQLPVATPPAVLGEGAGTRFSDQLDADRQIAQSVPAGDGWSLVVDGERAERAELFGWMQRYRTTSAGAATLTWSPPLVTRALQALQVLGLLALVLLARRRGSLVPRGSKGRRGEGDPLVVVAPDGEVLSSERDVSGGIASEPAEPGSVR